MANTLTQSPFQWLQALEQRGKQETVALPHQVNIEKMWRGITFRLQETYLIAPLLEIREILFYPKQLARVPGVKPWVKGLANIRGLLFPVFDLSAFLEGRIITIEKRTRMLIIHQSNLLVGLLVDEVLGIKSIPEGLVASSQPCQEAWIAPFAKGVLTYENITWTVFDMQALSESDLFLKVTR